MNVRLVAVGKVRNAYVAQACDEFARRLQPYFPNETIEVRGADQLAGRLHADDIVWLLDRAGKEFSSEELAQEIGGVTQSGASRLTLVIGDAFGVPAEVERRANLRWSLSRLTFLHEWARMLVLEQLYRAAKILRNEPYHH